MPNPLSEVISRICGQALTEHTLEQSMTEMESYWEEREFTLRKISVPKRNYLEIEKACLHSAQSKSRRASYKMKRKVIKLEINLITLRFILYAGIRNNTIQCHIITKTPAVCTPCTVHMYNKFCRQIVL